MTDSASVPTDETQNALNTAIGQRDALKKAGDAVVYELSHPTRHGRRLMEAIVAYRRLSEEIDAGERG